MIRDKQISLDKALELIEKEESVLMDKEKMIQDKIINKFELTKDEMSSILEKKHLEYLPKSNNIYEKIKSILYK